MWLTSTITLVRTLVVVVKPIRGLRNKAMTHLRVDADDLDPKSGGGCVKPHTAREHSRS